MKELKQADATLWEKLKELIQSLIDALADVEENYRDYAPNSVEAELVRRFASEEKQKLTRLYAEAFAAAEVQDETKGGGTETQYSNSERGEVDREKKKPYNKRRAYNEYESQFLQWKSGSASAGETKQFFRFGKLRFYEKTEDGCVELSRAQFGEANGGKYDKNYRQSSSKADNSSSGLRGERTGTDGDNARNRHQGNAPVVSRQTFGEELRHDSGGSVRSSRTDGERVSDRVNNSAPQNALDDVGGYSFSDRDSDGNTLSEAQQEYFKDSKVVNKQGHLRPVYHYTNEKFTKFETKEASKQSRKTMGDGFYFSTHPFEFSDFGKYKMEMYANVTNPFEKEMTKTEANKVYDKYFAPLHEDRFGTYRPHVIESLMSSYKVIDYLKEAAETNGTTTSAILSELGYDGIHDGIEWVAFKPEQLKNISNTEPTENEDIRYSDRGDYNGKSLFADGEVYSWDFMTKQKDMTVNELPPLSSLKKDGKISRETVVSLGMENAKNVGEENDDNASVKNSYTGRDIIISAGSIRHSLDFDESDVGRLRTNARISAIIGDVVKNAIPINGLKNKNRQAVGTYAMACLLNSGDRQIVAVLTIETHSSNLREVEYFDIAHSASGRMKKISSESSTRESGYGISAAPQNAAYAVTIADFLGIVNSTYRSILSEDVLHHFVEERPADGYYSGQVLFSDRDNTKKINFPDMRL